jgi:hypothetical protein
MFRLGGVNFGLVPVYGNVNPLFERTIEVNIAARLDDHGAFVNWYVSVVGLVVVFPDKKVVPTGVVTSQTIPPIGVPLAIPRVIENWRVAPASAIVGIATARFGVVTVFVSALTTDRPVSCVTNFTRRVYDVAFTIGNVYDVMAFEASSGGEFISVSVFPLIRNQNPTVAAVAVTRICAVPVFVNVGPDVIVGAVVWIVLVVGIAPKNPLYFVFSEIV